MAYDSNDLGRDMRDIRRSAASTAQSQRDIAGQQAAQSRSLRNIEMAAGANTVINGLAALNAARAANEQIAIQREQHALQQAMAEQTARYEFSMWRQTSDGAAFVDWQQRALALIPFLRDRDRAWHAAWAQAIGRARAETPEAERQRLLRQPARLAQMPLKVVSIIGSVLAGIMLLWLLPSIIALIGVLSNPGAVREDCLDHGGEEAFCAAASVSLPWITFAVNFFVPLLLLAVFLGLAIVPAVMRARRLRAARADRTVANEAAARIERWGFDPLVTQGAWYGWQESEAFIGYADRLEHLVRNGPSMMPTPSQLIPLQIPAPRMPSARLPEEIEQILLGFHRENSRLAP